MTIDHRPGATVSPQRSRGAERIEVWAFTAGSGMRASSVDELAAGLDDETRVSWVDVTGLTDPTLARLTARLGLAANGSRPSRDRRPHPRLEPFADHALAVILIPTLGQHSLSLVEVEVLITDRFLVFAHDEPLPFGTLIEERAARHPDLIAEDSAFLLFVLLDEWLRVVETITEELDERIEDMEERAIRDTSESFLDDLVDLKELGFDLSQAVDRHHAVFDAMLNPDFPFVAGEIVENHYRDLARRFERRVTAIRRGREAINNALGIFTSSTAHRTNRILMLLTMVSTILLPVTVIFSFFGTNFVDLPLFTTPMFILMWASVLAVILSILALFARSGMLRR